MGGDEFTALVESDEQTLVTLCAALITDTAAPVSYADRIITIGLSIGIARATGNDQDADTMLAWADHALYMAKNAGKNTFHFEEGGNPPG